MSKINIKTYVENILAPEHSTNNDDNLILKFLLELQECRAIGDIRLFFCIAIDLKSSIRRYLTLEPSGNPLIRALRETILNTYNHAGKTTKTFPKGIPPQIRFSLASKKPSNYTACFKCTTMHEYGRITSFKSYLRYVVRENMSPLTATKIPEDIDDGNLRRYFLSYLHKGTFREVDITKLGRPDSWVFVADKTEINLKTINSTSDASDLIDRLGFYIENLSPNEHFICLEYDPTFDEPLFQPESLTADWGNVNGGGGLGNEFFLSHGIVDEWGRTNSVSGTLNPMKERIHESFDYNHTRHYKMSCISVGTAIRNLGKGNMATLLAEASTRFENA